MRASVLGAFVRWLFKGCKTKLRDEIDGVFDGHWGIPYEAENYFIGILTSIVLIFIIVKCFFS